MTPLAPTSDCPGVSTFQEYRQRGYFPVLDGLRAPAILLVLFHHVFRGPADSFETLHHNGRFGVTLFFIVSGFLITTLLAREAADRGRISLRQFYARRAIRLLPLYYSVLALQCAVVFFTPIYGEASRALFVEKLPSYLFYYSNVLTTATQGPFFFAWSLAVEEQFYLWFGFILVFLRRRHVIALVAVALLAKAGASLVMGSLQEQSLSWRLAFSYQEGLLCGVLLGFALHDDRGYGVFARVFGSRLVLAALGSACAIPLLLCNLRSATLGDDLLLTALLTLFTGALVIRPGASPFTAPLMRHLGRVSYGVYLLHWFVVSALDRVIPADRPTWLFGSAALITWAVAGLSYHYFESPLIAWYRRRSRPPPGFADGERTEVAPSNRPVIIRPNPC